MKRNLLLLFCMLLPAMLMANPVGKEEAQKKALSFIGQKMGGTTRAKGRELHLVMSDEGMHIFNIGTREGFVIVSADDCAPDILGYADAGTFDPQDIPENMRAWLQGYTDEIKWMKARGIARYAEQAITRAEVKSDIAPLIQTTWDQKAPYNNSCPEYSPGNKSATGCVATAMAQVMYYHQWPESTTQEIPGYTSTSYSLPVSAVANGSSISWSNMINDYRSSYTSDQATAIAQLMLYCGTSVQMDYGPSSGASSYKVADALKTYFGYSNETTTFVSRSFYSYQNWINLLYNELKQSRPIIYGGQSSGGGHEFVCDGYQYEDYFHINWGWSGTSNGYFKLSALSPNEQGTGGSSSTDGYHFGQDATIGIQKTGGTGTILSIAANTVNLTLNSITLSSSSITYGNSVDVTLNVTNNSGSDYDGDLWIGQSNGLITGCDFLIKADETKDCVITFTPNFTGTADIFAYFPNASGTYNKDNSQNARLTVSASASNNVKLSTLLSVENSVETDAHIGDNIPVYNLYGNDFRAIVSLTNSSETPYYGQYYWVLIPNGESATVNSINVYVPANSNINVSFEVKDIDYSKAYILKTAYVYNNSYTLAPQGFYQLQHAIMTYAADGTKNITMPTTTFEVPENALAVDLTGTTGTVTSVTKNSKTNCLYILGTGDAEPSELTNVVKYDGSSYTASSITLTDGNDFYSPVDFTAENIEFTYKFTVGADGTNGWNTLVLPFDVTTIKANDTAIDWFRSSSDTGKNFWVKSFTSDESSTVNFDFLSGGMKANTPYILALPGNHWGTSHDLSGKTIKFIGNNTRVYSSETPSTVTGSYYRFIGSTVGVSTTNIYSLNAGGNCFEVNNSGSGAFRAYFKPDIYDRTVSSLAIGTGIGGTTDMNIISAQNTAEDDMYYNLNGQRVDNPSKGIYIKNGKKVIIK